MKRVEDGHWKCFVYKELGKEYDVGETDEREIGWLEVCLQLTDLTKLLNRAPNRTKLTANKSRGVPLYSTSGSRAFSFKICASHS